MCTHMCMATKTISIMEDAYRILLGRKMKGESFSEVIRRELSRRRNVLEFSGVWKDMGDKEINKMKKNLSKLRKDSTKELLKNDIY